MWAVAFSPDREWLATGDSDGNVQIWNAGSGKLLMKVAHRDWVYGVTFSPDKRRFATGSSDGTVRIWDAYTGEQKAILVIEYSRTVAFSPDGRLLAIASTPAQIWDARTGTERLTLSPHGPGSSERLCHDVAFSPDGRFLAAAYKDHAARIWDTRTGTELLKLTHGHEVRAVAFSPDGRWLATGDGQWQTTMRRGPGTIHVWQLKET